MVGTSRWDQSDIEENNALPDIQGRKYRGTIDSSIVISTPASGSSIHSIFDSKSFLSIRATVYLHSSSSYSINFLTSPLQIYLSPQKRCTICSSHHAPNAAGAVVLTCPIGRFSTSSQRHLMICNTHHTHPRRASALRTRCQAFEPRHQHSLQRPLPLCHCSNSSYSPLKICHGR
jgi:hypothetical protein